MILVITIIIIKFESKIPRNLINLAFAMNASEKIPEKKSVFETNQKNKKNVLFAKNVLNSNPIWAETHRGQDDLKFELMVSELWRRRWVKEAMSPWKRKRLWSCFNRWWQLSDISTVTTFFIGSFNSVELLLYYKKPFSFFWRPFLVKDLPQMIDFCHFLCTAPFTFCSLRRYPLDCITICS